MDVIAMRTPKCLHKYKIPYLIYSFAASNFYFTYSFIDMTCT